MSAARVSVWVIAAGVVSGVWDVAPLLWGREREIESTRMMRVASQRWICFSLGIGSHGEHGHSVGCIACVKDTV